MRAKRSVQQPQTPPKLSRTNYFFPFSILLTLVAMTTRRAFQNDIQVPLASSRPEGVCSLQHWDLQNVT